MEEKTRRRDSQNEYLLTGGEYKGGQQEDEGQVQEEGGEVCLHAVPGTKHL